MSKRLRRIASTFEHRGGARPQQEWYQQGKRLPNGELVTEEVPIMRPLPGSQTALGTILQLQAIRGLILSEKKK